MSPVSAAVDGPDAPGAPEGTEELLFELRKEASTMALYVAICLLAALSAVSEHAAAQQVDTFKIVWGTTVGLAIAHWFAFRVSARLVASGTVRRVDAKIAVAQVAGALAVAVLATVPVVIFSETAELDVTRLVLAVFVALVGYAVARGAGASVRRSLVYGGAILVIATVVALVKNTLVGH
jgi:hypothetical protein